jgi:16S rRNA (cytosine1402-N4)-methyltransferase
VDKEQAQNQTIFHQPVLLKEVVENLCLSKKRNIVDATLGLGGHTTAILENLPKAGKVIGFELDPDHLKAAKKNLRKFKDRVIYVNANFSTLKDSLKDARVKAVDGILFDLGMASPHVDVAEKGFSFLREGPLDMRFDPKQELTAATVVNSYSEKLLIRIFKEYGEEKKARKVALEIIRVRKRKPFKTTTQLADFIEKLLKRDGRIHPATRIFQALRIEVNHELDVLINALTQACEVLKPGSRIVVISYHSLEDRIVKTFFREQAREYINLPDQPTTTMLEPTLKIITKKPIVPTEEEIRRNPRSRSAKLRVAEKI